MENRKKFLAIAKQNLKAQGVILKKLPIRLLKTLTADGDGPSAVHANVQSAQSILDQIHVSNPGQGGTFVSRLAHWGRDGVSEDYITEVLTGSPWAKHVNVFVAFKSVFSQGQGYRMEAVGLLCFGTFNRHRYDGEHQFSIRLPTTTLNTKADNDQVAEIEVVVTDNTAQSRGLGTALFEYALGDIASRVKGGQGRYGGVVVISDDPRMRQLCLRYGFSQNNYAYEVAPPPQLREGSNVKIFTHLLTTPTLATALQAANGRVASTRVCPPVSRARNTSGSHSPVWPLCR
jgi:ribosomal protein S18 acetylase RimI-like enzyme